MNEQILRILLVDDHRIVRDGLRLLIQEHPDLTVVGEASGGTEALTLVRELRPDLILMDIHLQDSNGIEVSRQILTDWPQARIIILSAHPDPDFVSAALQAGVSAYMVKENAAEDLIRAIRAVRAGKTYLCPEVAGAMVSELRRAKEGTERVGRAPLSVREREVLRLVAEGLRNKEISNRLTVSIKTIETYRSRLMHKLGLASSAELVRYAIREGITSP